MARASSGVRHGRAAAQVERQDLVAGAVHPRDAAADEQSSGRVEMVSVSWLSGKGGISPSPRGCRSPARRAGSARREARRRRSSRRTSRPWRWRGRWAAVCAARRLSSASGPWRKATLPTQRQPRCALTRSMMAAARMLRLQREGAVDAQDQRRRRTASSGSRLRAARRPLQLDRPGKARRSERRRCRSSR